nr:uncharacterized protein LOC132779726 [Anolis sagrei ordinatus]
MDSRAAKMVQEISLALIFDAQKVLEELSEIDMRCNDLGKNPIANTFPEIKKKVQLFKDLCKQHRQTFQKELAGLLPSIRGGGKEEGALADILRSMNQSPFNSQKLQEFLKMKEREMDFVNSYLAILSGIEVLSSESKLNEIVLDHQNEFVISFTFTSLHDEEPFLANLQHYLHKEDKDNPGASVYFYEDGELVSCSFDLPSKPLPLLVHGIRHDSVQLTFQPAEYGRENITSYQVEYRIEGEENWKTVNTESSQETFLLRGLSPNTEYQFQYAVRCKPGLSETSNITQSVKTLPIGPPGKPREVTVEPSMISVAWGSPSVIGVGAVIKEYKVEYREETGHENIKSKDAWNERRTGRKTELFQISGLNPQMVYRLRVSAVCADGTQSIPSEEVEVSTSLDEVEKDRLVQKYLPKSRLLVEGQPSIYALPLEVASDDSTSCLTYCLGEENPRVSNKVIMVMGATGSGKTTLINGMINYILGVQWEDKFRFKLIHEETNRSQAESQTSEVTAYMVNHQKGFKVPFSLTIIDTPGFGDTRGLEHDKLITEKIRTFFSTPGEKHPDHIDAICIVVQASLARLTQPQKYVFDSILSIFGRDIKDNIQILVTFADGQSPPVLEAIKEGGVPYSKDADGAPVHFKFNNSALFANKKIESGGSLNFDEMFWKMGCESMKTFFDSSNALETRSLTLTKEVLRERKHLEAAVEGLEPQIQAGLVKLEELRKTQQALDQHRDEMTANENFEYEVDKTIPVKEDISGSGNFITNCMNCHYTCHYPCTIAEDDWKYCCAAMDSNTKTCEVCPGRCAWNIHYNQKYKFSYKVVKEKKTYEDLKQKYEHASGEVMTTAKVFEILREEYEDVKHILEDLIKQSSQSLCRLQEIALKPNPLSTPEYIDLLIMSEKEELKPGYQERIQVLKEMRRKAEIIQKIANNKPLLPEEKTIYDQTEERKNLLTGQI